MYIRINYHFGGCVWFFRLDTWVMLIELINSRKVDEVLFKVYKVLNLIKLGLRIF